MAERPPVTGAGAASPHRKLTLPPLGLSVGGGTAPPPGAPHEVAQPLQPDAGSVAITNELGQVTILTPAALAAANERELAPLTYGRVAGEAAPPPPAAASGVQVPREVVAAGPVPDQTRVPEPAAPLAPTPLVRVQRRPFQRAIDARAAADERDRLKEQRKTEKAAQVAAASEKPVQPDPLDAAIKAVQEPRPVLPAGGPGAQVAEAFRDRGAQASRVGHQPAASNTDSPSRGIPRAIADPGKQITGGFGDAADAQYFPLDGTEVLSMVWVLMDELAQRLQNDLRFSIATVYPRVAIRAQVVVEGYAADQNFTIERLLPPHDKTPIEVAERWGDQVVFVVSQERREFNADGTIASPPNAMRQEIGVVAPRKQFVGYGSTRQLVDVPPGEMT